MWNAAVESGVSSGSSRTAWRARSRNAATRWERSTPPRSTTAASRPESSGKSPPRTYIDPVPSWSHRRAFSAPFRGIRSGSPAIATRPASASVASGSDSPVITALRTVLVTVVTFSSGSSAAGADAVAVHAGLADEHRIDREGFEVGGGRVDRECAPNRADPAFRVELRERRRELAAGLANTDEESFHTRRVFIRRQYVSPRV